MNDPLSPAGDTPLTAPPETLAAQAEASASASASEPPAPARRVGVGFLLRHPAHFIALGAGSGLSPVAPGTAGTLWAWLAFLVLDPWLSTAEWGGLLVIGTVVGWWACTVAATHARIADPGFIVWDEIIAFWLVLWVLTPANLGMQAIAFGLFRYFDAAKPGPVRWADQRFKGGGWRGGWGILFDDFVAAGCTLFTLAVGVTLARLLHEFWT